MFKLENLKKKFKLENLKTCFSGNKIHVKWSLQRSYSFRTTSFSDGLDNFTKFKISRSSGPHEKTLSGNFFDLY